MSDVDSGRTLPSPRQIMAECAALNTRRIARLITQRYDEVLRPFGVRSTQLPFLMVLARSAQATIQELAADIIVDRTTVTRNLKTMEQKGWVEITRGDDQRSRVVALTQSGRDLVARIIPAWQTAQDKLFAELGESTVTDLVKETRRLTSSLIDR